MSTPCPLGSSLVQTFDYVPARDGLALLTGGPTDAGYAANAAANPKRVWQPRISVLGTTNTKGGTDSFSGNYQWNVDPEYPWSNGFTPFAIDANGNLRIRAQTTSSAGFSAGEIPTNPNTSATYSYVSGCLSSKATFFQQCGYFEVIGKFPTGTACWNGVYMFPPTDIHPPEIDIAEIAGGSIAATSYNANVISKTGANASVINGGQDLGAGFHKYAISITDVSITFYLDDVLVKTTSITTLPEFATPFYFLVINQIGSTIGGWVPAPDGTTPAIADVLIRSIRAWQYQGPIGVNLSASTYLDNLGVGGTVATISATNSGGNAAYTFTKPSDPDSMFTVSGSNLNLAQVVLATTKASHAVTLQVADGVGRTRQTLFNIGVITNAPIQANYFTSQDLTNAFWSKGNLTAPNSNTIMETVTNGTHQLSNASLIPRTAGVKTFNTWIEATPTLSRALFTIKIFDSSFASQAYAYFNLTTVTVAFSSVAGTWSSNVPFITLMPSGRIRCGFKFTTDGTTTGIWYTVNLEQDATDVLSYVGDVTKGLKIDNPWLYNTGAGSGGT